MKKRILITLLMAFMLVACSTPALPPTLVPSPGETSTPESAPATRPTDVPSSSGERPSGMAAVAESSKARVTRPDVPPADAEALVDGNSAFAFSLYRLLKDKQAGNLFYSPYSISQALAMTYAGARGETEQQMAEALHFTLPQERLHPAFNSLDQALAQRGEGARGKDGKGFRLHIVNAIWGQAGYDFLSDFLDVLAENYGAGMRLLDFVNATEAARVTINTWISEQTEGRIEDLIPAGALTPLTRLVLTNAIYFNAAWAEPFQEEATEDAPFYLLDGGQMMAPLMRQTTSLGYAEGQGYQAVEIPYDGGELAMVVVLPESLDDFEAHLDAPAVEGILDALSYRQVALAMPKFEFEAQFSLVEALAAMGMPVAFSEAADFSGMTGNRDLMIGDVIHKAFVAVDEAGTEAAAATAVIMKLTAMEPQEPVQVTVDHPFLFFIRDLQTGAILFVGRVVNPGA